MGARFDITGVSGFAATGSWGTLVRTLEMTGKQFNRLPYVFLARVRILLNHCQALPATEFLNRLQIGTPHYQPTRESVPWNRGRNPAQFSMPAVCFKGGSKTQRGIAKYLTG